MVTTMHGFFFVISAIVCLIRINKLGRLGITSAKPITVISDIGNKLLKPNFSISVPPTPEIKHLLFVLD